jgi:hypothetical protein
VRWREREGEERGERDAGEVGDLRYVAIRERRERVGRQVDKSQSVVLYSIHKPPNKQRFFLSLPIL